MFAGTEVFFFFSESSKSRHYSDISEYQDESDYRDSDDEALHQVKSVIISPKKKGKILKC